MAAPARGGSAPSASGSNLPSTHWWSIDDVPDSALRRQIKVLPSHAQHRALEWLRRIAAPVEDLHSINVDAEGGIYYEDHFELPTAPVEDETTPPISAAAVPVAPFPDHLKFHSRPGAPNVIYINFAGERVSNTAWNDSLGRSEIPAVPFSTDEDYDTFSDAEQTAIKQIWQRVAEDYAPFDVDVTTERPTTFGTRTAHALVTRNTDANGQNNPAYTSAGVAYVDVFGSLSFARYRPAWIYFNQLAKNESFIAEGVSHEIGHNFGLTHDGKTDGTEYYAGHGSGETSWGPIMGLGYNRNVSQWSKGEYYLANNKQDDLAILASKAPYRADDVGNTFTTAAPLKIVMGTNIVATTPDTDPSNTNRANKGVLEKATDVDVFSFATGTGPVKLLVSPWSVPGGYTRGGNLDITAELYTQNGTLLLTNNAFSSTSASLTTELPEGTYYLLIRSTGAGSPLASSPTGYTSYGSIGQYFISGTVSPFSGILPPRAQLEVADITTPGAGEHPLTITYSDNAEILVSTLDHTDIRVTGPGAYDRMARLISINPPANATTVTANYAADPPNRVAWTPVDNGTYTVWMQTNQVSDTEGAWVGGGKLGEFAVNVPLVVYTADMSVNPNWSLEPLWHYGKPAAGESGPSAGFTGANIIGYNLAGDYEPNLPLKYATTPLIDCRGASGLTLSFKRWLRTRNGDSAIIQISTNGLNWTDLWVSTRTVADSGWVDARHTLPAWVDGASSLRIRWGMASGPALQDTGWNIDDVLLLAGSTIDEVPPAASLAVDTVTSAGDFKHALRVTYTDNMAVRADSLDSSDLIVLGSDASSNQVEFVLLDVPSDGSPRLATYHVSPPGGTWDATDNGAYQVILRDGEVSDTSGNTIPQTVLGSFLVDIDDPPPMLLIEPAAIQVPEGGTATAALRLSKAPVADVVVTTVHKSGDPDLFVQSGAEVTFSSLNWSNPVSITIGAAMDLDREDGSATFECSAPNLASVVLLAVEQDLTPASFTLQVAPNNPQWGTTIPESGEFAAGTSVLVEAFPALYFQFDRWTGDVLSMDNPVLVSVTSNVLITAEFNELLTTNFPTPLWWLASVGITNDFEVAVESSGLNGIPLWQSYIAGLDPLDPDAQLRLSVSAVPGSQEYVLTWDTVEGRVYSLEKSTSLLGDFEAVLEGEPFPAGTAVLTNAIPPGISAIYYRLKVEKP